MTSPASAQETIVVGVGDCRVAAAPAHCIVTYALGSCIAVMAWDWKHKLGGLLHVMLPDSSIDPVRAVSHPFMYVDTGVPALLADLTRRGCVKNQLRWCLAGGAGMMVDSAPFEIGKRNYLAIRKTFWRLGLFISHEDVGGSESRSVRLDVRTGRIGLRKGTGAEEILAQPSLRPFTSLMPEGGKNDGSIAR